jgi:hypothetical protein
VKLLGALLDVKSAEIWALSQKKTSPSGEALWSGLRDSNPRPSPWQGSGHVTCPPRKWRIPNKIGVYGEDPDHRFSLFYPPFSLCRVLKRVHPPINPGARGEPSRRCSIERLSYSRRAIALLAPRRPAWMTGLVCGAEGTAFNQALIGAEPPQGSTKAARPARPGLGWKSPVSWPAEAGNQNGQPFRLAAAPVTRTGRECWVLFLGNRKARAGSTPSRRPFCFIPVVVQSARTPGCDPGNPDSTSGQRDHLTLGKEAHHGLLTDRAGRYPAPPRKEQDGQGICDQGQRKARIGRAPHAGMRYGQHTGKRAELLAERPSDAPGQAVAGRSLQTGVPGPQPRSLPPGLRRGRLPGGRHCPRRLPVDIKQAAAPHFLRTRLQRPVSGGIARWPEKAPLRVQVRRLPLPRKESHAPRLDHGHCRLLRPCGHAVLASALLIPAGSGRPGGRLQRPYFSRGGHGGTRRCRDHRSRLADKPWSPRGPLPRRLGGRHPFTPTET